MALRREEEPEELAATKLDYEESKVTGALSELKASLAAIVDARVGSDWEDLDRALRQDDEWLTRFLRVRKYDVDRASSGLRSNLELSRYLEQLPTSTGGFAPKEDSGLLARDVKFWDLGLSTPVVQRILDLELVRTLPGRALDGSAVLAITVCDGFIDVWRDCGVGPFTMGVLKLLEMVSLDPATQAAGITLVIDMRNASGALIATSLRADMLVLTKKLASLITGKAAFRMRGLWLLGAPWYARALVSLVKAVMTAKLRSRLHTPAAPTALAEAIEPSLLPAALGGSASSLPAFGDCLRQLRS